MSIQVTKTFLPSFDEYTSILKRAWDKGWITNNGELVVELEEKLKEYMKKERMMLRDPKLPVGVQPNTYDVYNWPPVKK